MVAQIVPLLSTAANAQCKVTEDLPIKEGMINSGASYHMSGDEEAFENFRRSLYQILELLLDIKMSLG